jgi:hypothetical protein
VPSTSPVWLWPSLRQAGRMLRVHAATLSRRGVATEQCGQERRVSPTLVLELGQHYRRRDLGELGGALISYAEDQPHNTDELELLEADIERYFAAVRPERPTNADAQWLAEAERRLPQDVYDRVLEVFKTGERVESFRGVHFDEDDEG